METDFKLSFLANQSAKPDMSVQTSLKTSEAADNKSFEKTLSDKRKETNVDKKERHAEKAKEDRNNEKTERRKEKPRSRNAESTETNEKSDRVRGEKQDERADKPRETDKRGIGDIDKAGVETDSVDEEMLPSDISEEVIILVAEALGVTPEQVELSLKELGLKPEDLASAENVNSLIMSVNDMEDPTELLKMPNLQQMRKDIKGIFEEALKKAAEQNTGELTQAEAGDQDEAGFSPLNGITDTDSMEVYKAVKAPFQDAENNELNTGKAARTEERQVAGKEGFTEDLEDTQNSPVAQQSEPRNRVPGFEPQNGQNSRSDREGTHENPDKPQLASTEPIELGSVIIQKGDETVVEVGGKAVSRTPQRPVVQANDVINQIVDKMKVDFKPGSTEIKINLRPDDLGDVTVKIATESGRVTAEIITENSKIKELVEENISELKESLLKQGLDVGELSVSVGQQESDERMKQFVWEQNKSRARMTQIINRITGEEIEIEQANYADAAEINGSTVNFSA